MTPETKNFLQVVGKIPVHIWPFQSQSPKFIVISSATRERVWQDANKKYMRSQDTAEDLGGICRFQIEIDDNLGLFEYRVR